MSNTLPELGRQDVARKGAGASRGERACTANSIMAQAHKDLDLHLGAYKLTCAAKGKKAALQAMVEDMEVTAPSLSLKQGQG